MSEAAIQARDDGMARAAEHADRVHLDVRPYRMTAGCSIARPT